MITLATQPLVVKARYLAVVRARLLATRSLGAQDGHPFYGNQWTAGGAVSSLPEHPTYRVKGHPEVSVRTNPLKVTGSPSKDPAWTDARPEVVKAIGNVQKATRDGQVEMVKIKDLSTYQTFVSSERMLQLQQDHERTQRLRMPGESKLKNPLGVAFEHKGKLWLVDGNHRVAMAKLRGEKTIPLLRIKSTLRSAEQAQDTVALSYVFSQELSVEEPAPAAKRALAAKLPVHAVADAAVPTIRKAFLQALRGLNPSEKTFATKLEARLSELLAPVLQRVVVLSGQAHTMTMRISEDFRAAKLPTKPGKVKLGMKFDVKNPRAIAWAKKHAAELARDLAKESVLAVRAVVSSGIANGRTVVKTAKLLEAVIGLTERQGLALLGMQEKLELEGLSDQDIQDEVFASAQDMLESRADTIAHTETMRASNEGQQQLWEQAVDEGLLTGTELKEWIVTPDDRLCPICEAMDGQTTELDGEFDVDGEAVSVPPAHPNCRCTIGISAMRASEEVGHPFHGNQYTDGASLSGEVVAQDGKWHVLDFDQARVSLIERESGKFYIDKVKVESKFRNQGYGKALYERALDYAVSKGGDGLHSDARLRNDVELIYGGDEE